MQTNHLSADHFTERTREREAMRRVLSLIVVIVTFLFFAPHTAQAAAGDLDPHFGSGGMVQTDFFSV